MRIAALLALHSPVAAATVGSACAPAVAALPLDTAGQLAPAATHPTPPASGSTRAPRDFDARLLHLVGDNKLGVSRGSGLAAAAVIDRQAPPASERPSAISTVAPPPPATSITSSQHRGAGDGGDLRAPSVVPAGLELNEQ